MPFLKPVCLSIVYVACWLAGAQSAGSAESATGFDFPRLDDGRFILAVDLHTHTVFSDGRVWPAVRVEEARRDGLAAVAITDHLEWQPHWRDIPNADRNRPYELAQSSAPESVLVIAGVEVTRGMPPGHYNAVFIEDANVLNKLNAPPTETSDELYADTRGETKTFLATLEEARRQGALLRVQILNSFVSPAVHFEHVITVGR